MRKRWYRSGGLMSRTARSPQQLVEALQQVLEADIRKFNEMDFIVEAAALLPQSGKYLYDNDDEVTSKKYGEFTRKVGTLYERLEEIILGGKLNPTLECLRVKYEFPPIDMIILLTLTAGSVGLGPGMDDIDDVQKYLSFGRFGNLEVARALLPEGRLVGSGLVNIEVEDPFKNS